MYNERYNIPWASTTNAGSIYIDQIDGTLGTEELILAKDGLTINTTYSDWNEPIFSQTAQITILNYKDNFFELMPLLTSEEREFKIRVVQTIPSSKKLFEGFLNTDIVEQTYLKNQSIRLVASSYIKKLDNGYPTSINTIQMKSFIDLISESLCMNGMDASIYVNMDVYPTGTTLGTTNTALNLAGVSAETFWKNNAEKESGLEIIERILKTFDSYIYWYNGNWYIERYEDLTDYPKHYVGYNMNASYGYNSTGTSINVSEVSGNIFNDRHLNKSQLLSIIPGLNKIEIKLNSDIVSNFTASTMTNAKAVGYVPTVMYPAIKEINYYKSSTHNFTCHSGLMFNVSYGYDIREPYSVINSSLIRYGWPYIGSTMYYDYASIATKFKITIDPSSDKQDLVITWNYMPIIADGTSILNNDYQMRWYLRHPVGNNFIIYDKDSEHWYEKNTTDAEVYVQTTEITGDSLDAGTYLGSAKATIKINDPSLHYSGDEEFIFGIMIEKMKPTASSEYTSTSHPLMAAYGDLKITTAGLNTQSNYIETIVSNKFLNKKTITLDIYDVNSLDYTNGIYTGDKYGTRTLTWNDGTTDKSLIDRLITNKFQLYNRSRQKISSTISSSDYLKPLSLWYDIYQPAKKFILTGYSYHPTENQYDCDWSEFDNSETININNAT
ncbi:MAG: hypothetical protein LLG13_10995 [Bacteroidales bacterium]|nr:hypothetical protein [Bacteroidales bacterium]